MLIVATHIQSESYNTLLWGEDCQLLCVFPGQPCWGAVMMADDGERLEGETLIESGAVYLCQGHINFPREYLVEPEVPGEEEEASDQTAGQ